MSILQEIINDRSVSTISQNLYCKKDAHLCFFLTTYTTSVIFYLFILCVPSPCPLLQGFLYSALFDYIQSIGWLRNLTISIVIYSIKIIHKSLNRGLQTELSVLLCVYVYISSVVFKSWCRGILCRSVLFSVIKHLLRLHRNGYECSCSHLTVTSPVVFLTWKEPFSSI